MKLKILFFLLLISATFSNEIFAQTTQEDWYTPLRNKLLHITISKDSITFRKCSFDVEMKDYGYVFMGFKIEKKVNNNYIISETKDKISTIYLMIFKLENDRVNLNIESLNTSFLSVADAENAIKTFELNSLNITLIDKPTIDKIRQQADINTMTPNEFKNCALKIIELDSKNSAYLKRKYKLTSLYIDSTLRLIVSDLGFNGLAGGNKFDTMLEKFSENPETKELFLKMTNGGN